jgi:serine/threonine protein kinase
MDMLCTELNGRATFKFKHICQLYGVSIVSDEEVWLVLEYVDGPNLHDFLVSNGPVSWYMQLSFALQAAKAINYLHSQNPPLLHKDIKSLSLIVDVSASTIKLTDFGISKASEFVTSQTNVIGSLRWAAPEVVKPGKQKEPKWSEKSDIYSLGMVFFEIIASEFPFRYDSNFGSIAKKIKRGMRPTIPQHCPEVHIFFFFGGGGRGACCLLVGRNLQTLCLNAGTLICLSAPRLRKL